MDEFELAILYSLNPPLAPSTASLTQAQANLNAVVNTDDGGCAFCLERLLTPNRVTRPEVAFWCLQVIAGHTDRLSPEQLLRLCASPSVGGDRQAHTVPPYVRNKLTQAVVQTLRDQYPSNWPTAFADLLSMDDTDLMLRVLRALDEQLLAHEAQAGETATRVKNAMRSEHVVEMLLDWWRRLVQGEEASEAGRSGATDRPAGDCGEACAAEALDLLGRYVEWMDIRLVMDHFAAPLQHLAMRPPSSVAQPVQSAAIRAMRSVVAKKVATAEAKLALMAELGVLEVVLARASAASALSLQWTRLVGQVVAKLLECAGAATAAESAYTMAASVLERCVLSPTVRREHLNTHTLPAVAAYVASTAPHAAAIARLALEGVVAALEWQQASESAPADAADEGESEDRDEPDGAAALSEHDLLVFFQNTARAYPKLALEALPRATHPRATALLLVCIANTLPEAHRSALWEAAAAALAAPFVDKDYFELVVRFAAPVMQERPWLWDTALRTLMLALAADEASARATAAATAVRVVHALRQTLLSGVAAAAAAAGETAATPGNSPVDSNLSNTGGRRQPSRDPIEYLLAQLLPLIGLGVEDADLESVQLPLIECVSLLIGSDAMPADARAAYLDAFLGQLESAGLLSSRFGAQAVLRLSKGFTPAMCAQEAPLARLWCQCLDVALRAVDCAAPAACSALHPLLHRLLELLPLPSTCERMALFVKERLRVGTTALPTERHLAEVVLLLNQMLTRVGAKARPAQECVFEPLIEALLLWFPLLPAATGKSAAGAAGARRAALMSEVARERVELRSLLLLYLFDLLSGDCAAVMVGAAGCRWWPRLQQLLVCGSAGEHLQWSGERDEAVAVAVPLEETYRDGLTKSAISVLLLAAEQWSGRDAVPDWDASLLQGLPRLFRVPPALAVRESVQVQALALARLTTAQGVLAAVMDEALQCGCAAEVCNEYAQLLLQLAADERPEPDRSGAPRAQPDAKVMRRALQLLKTIAEALRRREASANWTSCSALLTSGAGNGVEAGNNSSPDCAWSASDAAGAGDLADVPPRAFTQ